MCRTGADSVHHGWLSTEPHMPACSLTGELPPAWGSAGMEYLWQINLGRLCCSNCLYGNVYGSNMIAAYA